MSPYFTAGFNVGNDTRTEISSFGLNLGAGIDYYVAENIYLGLELGFNYNSADGTKTSGFAGGSAVRMGWRF
jgi:opacity protein-like surface antigen